MNKEIKKAKYRYSDKNNCHRNIEYNEKNHDIFLSIHNHKDKFVPYKKGNNHITVLTDDEYNALKNFTKLNDSWIHISDKAGNFTQFTTLNHYEYSMKEWCKIIRSSEDQREYSFMEIPADTIDYEFNNRNDESKVYCEYVTFNRKDKAPLIVFVNNRRYGFDSYKYIGDNTDMIFKDFNRQDILGNTESKFLVFINCRQKSSGKSSIGRILPYVAAALAFTPRGQITKGGGYPPEHKRRF